eukprot:6483782-Amphidinium_carterae.1
MDISLGLPVGRTWDAEGAGCWQFTLRWSLQRLSSIVLRVLGPKDFAIDGFSASGVNGAGYQNSKVAMAQAVSSSR